MASKLSTITFTFTYVTTHTRTLHHPLSTIHDPMCTIQCNPHITVEYHVDYRVPPWVSNTIARDHLT